MVAEPTMWAVISHGTGRILRVFTSYSKAVEFAQSSKYLPFQIVEMKDGMLPEGDHENSAQMSSD